MKCQRCKEREANVQIMQQISGKKPQTFYLCDSCARELGISIPNISKTAKFTANPFTAMNGIFSVDFGLGAQVPGTTRSDTCDKCGLSFEEFKKTGFLGCAHCYDAFAMNMDPVFLRTQMGKEHVGRKMGRKSVKSNGVSDAGSSNAEQSKALVPAEEPAKSTPPEKVTISPLVPDTDEESEELQALERLHLERLIEEKQADMAAAVAAENYLLAASLRDEITLLRKQKDGEQA